MLQPLPKLLNRGDSCQLQPALKTVTRLILRSSKTATPEQIKQACRQLDRNYHPELNPADKYAETQFKDLNQAHRVLSEPEKLPDRSGDRTNQPGCSLRCVDRRFAGTIDRRETIMSVQL